MTDVQQGSTEALAEKMAERALVPSATGKTLVERIKEETPRFAASIPPGSVKLERFERSVLTLLKSTPKLLECSPGSVLGAITVAAQLGLEFGPLGLAYLVPFWNNKERRRDAQLIVGYQGYLELARRTGLVKSIVAREVYSKDKFRMWTDETGDHVLHEPFLDTDRGDVVRYYGLAVFTNGGSHVQLMSLDDVAARRERSQTANSDHSPWKTDPLPMARKSVVRAMVPWLPLTTEIAQGVAADERIVTLQGRDLVVADPVAAAEPPEPPSARTQMESRLSDAMGLLDPSERTACGRYLLETFGPLASVPDEKLEEIIETALKWGTESPEAPESPPVPEPAPTGAEASTAPPETVEPEAASPEPHWVDALDFEVPPEIEAAIDNEVAELNAQEVVARLKERSLPYSGKAKDLRDSLKGAIARDRLLTKPAAEDKWTPTGDESPF